MAERENKKSEHHAYLVTGADGFSLDELKKILSEKFSFDAKNPDLFAKSFNTFGIDDSRTLKEMQSRKGNFGSKIFILKINFFTGEAQNALLKVFEEPTPGTRIFLAAPRSANILPTLKSRLFDFGDISREGLPRRSLAKVGNKVGESALDFLTKNAPERLKFLKKIIEDKDKFAALTLLNGLEEFLGKRVSADTSPEEVFILEEIRKGREYLNSRAPSVKMILEHISLIMPASKSAL